MPLSRLLDLNFRHSVLRRFFDPSRPALIHLPGNGRERALGTEKPYDPEDVVVPEKLVFPQTNEA